MSWPWIVVLVVSVVGVVLGLMVFAAWSSLEDCDWPMKADDRDPKNFAEPEPELSSEAGEAARPVRQAGNDDAREIEERRRTASRWR